MSKKKTNIEQIATIKTSGGKTHQNSDILSGGGHMSLSIRRTIQKSPENPCKEKEY